MPPASGCRGTDAFSLCLPQDDPDADDDLATLEAEAARDEVRTGRDIDAGEEAMEQGLKPGEIDAFWLQRNISKAFGKLDETEAVLKAEEVFQALSVSVILNALALATFHTSVIGLAEHHQSWL